MATELSFESTPTTCTWPELARATLATAASSARQSGHHEAKKLTMTGVPRKEDSATGAPPPSAGSEKAGAVVPAFSVAGGGVASAAELGVVGLAGPRVTTNTTKPMRQAPATAATTLKTRSRGARRGAS